MFEKNIIEDKAVEDVLCTPRLCRRLNFLKVLRPFIPNATISNKSQLSNDHHMDIRINLWDMRGYLCIHIDKYDSAAARNMIQNNPKIMPLLEGFDYYNEWDIYSKPFAGDICESSRDSTCYLWGHDTERVAEAIFETYMRPFMTDEIADFFVQVCNKTKKDKQ